MGDVTAEISLRARTGAHVASESPQLASYYAQRAKRPDLVCVSLSDPEALQQLVVGDFVILARGRRYFSNDALISALGKVAPDFKLSLGTVPSAEVYVLNNATLGTIREVALQMQSPGKPD
jgi:hypothetical protein